MAEMGTPSTVKEQDYYHDPFVREQVLGRCLSIFELYAATPDESGFAIPQEGGWIIVKEQPNTVIPNPPLYSIWRAQPVYTGRKMKVSAGGRKRWINWPMLKARIKTQHGDLDLWPGEYVPTSIEKWMDLIGEGVIVNFLGAQPDELAQRMFYLRSRGLSEHDAVSLLLPDIETNDYVYLTLEGVNE